MGPRRNRGKRQALGTGVEIALDAPLEWAPASLLSRIQRLRDGLGCVDGFVARGDILQRLFSLGRSIALRTALKALHLSVSFWNCLLRDPMMD